MIPERKPDGEFSCFETWVNKATSWIGGMNAACFDAKDRRCLNGGDMVRARDENAFPVRFWYGEDGQSKAEQKRRKRNAEASLKIMYPWRYK